jgi:hypothetical protein
MFNKITKNLEPPLELNKLSRYFLSKGQSQLSQGQSANDNCPV